MRHATAPSLPASFDTSADAAPAADRVVALHYPQSWFTVDNAESPLVEQRLQAWFRSIGVIHDPETADRFQRMQVGRYGGAPFPLADADTLEIVTGMLSLWIFYDDAIEGLGANDEHELLAAVAGQPRLVGRDSPCVRGFRELGMRLGSRRSPAWMLRHAAHFGAWLQSVRHEAQLSRRFRGPRAGGPGPLAPIGVEEHMQVREINVGVIPVLDWIEHELDRELPAEHFDHPATSVITRAACRAVAFANELYGYSKDREQRWINSVACAEREHRCSTAEAFARIAQLHDLAIEEISLAGSVLVAEAADRPLVRAWMRRVRSIVSGFARWHAAAPRYRARHAATVGEEGVELRIVVR